MNRKAMLCFLLLAGACGSEDPAVNAGPDAATQPQPDAPPVTQPDAPPQPQPDAAEQPPQPDAGSTVPTGDLGFRPATDGFSFENYSNDGQPVNLTAAEMRRMFGDVACADIDGQSCTLTPAADQWMQEVNGYMGGGHCEGFAVLSLLFFTGQKNEADFGAASTFGLKLADNTSLQSELAYWWATQVTSPATDAFIKDLTPVAVADKLAAAFKNRDETYVIHLFKPGPKDGHAITPYAVVDAGNDKTKIMVYDNNWPNEERFIEVDRVANTWKYLAATNPNEAEALYEGDASTFSLQLAPNAQRMGKQECGFCSSGTSKTAFEERQIWLSGDADLVISDEQGHRLGMVAGSLINEIPGASALQLTSASLFKDDPEPIYHLPGTGALDVLLDGSLLTAPGSASVTMIAPGYVFGVEDVMLDPFQRDQISFSSDGTEIVYLTEGMETPEVFIGVETTGSDYLFIVKTAGEAQGQGVGLKLDQANGKVRIDVNAGDGVGGYGIVVVRIDEDGAALFSHEGNTESMVDSVYLDYANWQGNGSPMTMEIDKGSDGTIDETYEIADQN